MSLDELHVTKRERIIRGQQNWWFLGPGGIARVRAQHLTAEGNLSPSSERHLRERGLFTVAPPSVYSLTVLMTTDCNLGCGYCFQNTGQDELSGTRPPRIPHARLSSDGITTLLEFAGRQMAQTGLDKLHILLFGGEPLMNPRGCRELLARAADYGLVSAAMISNLTMLTPLLARQLGDLGLGSLQVTFDGDRASHDLIRVRRSGGGTFDAILGNLASAIATAPQIRWALRVNVSHHNYSGIDSLIERIAGAVPPASCRIYFARVGDVGIGYANELLHTGELAACFTRWQRRAIDLGFSIVRPQASTPCATCGYGDARYGAVVSADGTLASCWETAGRPGWEVGDMVAGYLPAEQTRDHWIGCEDTYRYGDDAQALAAFRDTVDAALLDYLDETGRL